SSNVTTDSYLLRIFHITYPSRTDINPLSLHDALPIFYNHTFLPSYYDDPVTEYWHLIEQVAIWDVGVERQVEISGPDALTLTQRDRKSTRLTPVTRSARMPSSA